jgi:hydroxymethylpyrimidine/phosphomethylpyrimidine kinase
VVVKGGHSNESDCTDLLCYRDGNQELKMERFKSIRLATQNTHGTGCTFSAAIAALLSHRTRLVEAVREAKAYTFDSISRGMDNQLGHGNGPLIHLARSASSLHSIIVNYV